MLHIETFSTSKWDNILSTHLVTIELLTSENGKVHEETRKMAANYAKKTTKAIVKVEKILIEVQEFMKDFRTTSDKSVADMNKVIEGFRISLQ